MSTLGIAAWPARARLLFPRVLACVVVAAAATFLSNHCNAPLMLFALLLGMAMNFLGAGGPCTSGIEFAARQLSRTGVALLGLRITARQVAALGGSPALPVVVSLVLTIAVSMLAARTLGFQSLFGLLSGNATAICGASAARVLPSAAVAERVGLSSSDLECPDFIVIAGAQAITAGQLAAATGFTSAAITGLVDRLERAGLVRREPDATDRRSCERSSTSLDAASRLPARKPHGFGCFQP